MARHIHRRLRIEGKLEALTPLHVGGYGTNPDTDLPLALNGKGEWYVPGTSIAGVIRSWFEKNFDNKVVGELFGPRRVPGKEEGHASFVQVEDAVITLPKGLDIEIRDGVGIDRYYGAAADQAKYDRAVVPRGSTLNFSMKVEIESLIPGDPKSKDPDRKIDERKEEFETRVAATLGMTAHLLDSLKNEELRFGAARTRGLGRVKLLDARVAEDQLDQFAGIKLLLEQLTQPNDTRSYSLLEQWLASEAVKDARGKVSCGGHSRLEILVRWRPQLPVMVKAGYEGVGVDALPLTSGVAANRLSLVLPGSSIKGTLRSQSERIVRTLLPLETTKDAKFHDQINKIPLVEELFGSSNKPEVKDGKLAGGQGNNDRVKLGLAALGVDDCYATETMDAKKWRQVEVALGDKPGPDVKAGKEKKTGTANRTDSGQGEVSYYKRELWKYLREIDESKDKLEGDIAYQDRTRKFQIEHHVAIDRWTGGASEGALYSVLAPAETNWEPIRLTVDLDRVTEKSQVPALMLLLLTLRDVAEGRLPFGFATNRGMGEIAVTEIEFKGRIPDALTGITAAVNNDKCVFSGDTECLEKDWTEWLTDQTKKLSTK